MNGLVDAGIWPDDTDEWVIVLDPAFRRCDDDTVTVELQARAEDVA